MMRRNFRFSFLLFYTSRNWSCWGGGGEGSKVQVKSIFWQGDNRTDWLKGFPGSSRMPGWLSGRFPVDGWMAKWSFRCSLDCWTWIVSGEWLSGLGYGWVVTNLAFWSLIFYNMLMISFFWNYTFRIPILCKTVIDHFKFSSNTNQQITKLTN